MVALATTHDGDVPLFLQPLDGTSLDKVSLLAAVMAIQKQLRVSETSSEAKAVLQEGSQDWQQSADGSIQWYRRIMTLPQGSERWVIVRTTASAQRAQATLQRQVSRAQASWERKCWHLGTRRFACEADARAALERELKGKPTWVEVHRDVVAHPRHAGKGRPRKDVSPATHQWQIVATVTVNKPRADEEALRKACFIVGTNELESEALSDQELVTTYKEQGGVERGFRFLRISAVPGLLGHSQETGAHYRPEFDYGVMLAGLSLSRIPTAGTPGRDRADHSRPGAQTHSTPDDAALVFQCFEGIELLHVQTSTTALTIVLRLESVHRLILALLGPLYEKIYNPSG